MTEVTTQTGMMVIGGLVSLGLLVLAGVCVRALVRVSDQVMRAADRQRIDLGQASDRQRRDADAKVATMIEKLLCAPEAVIPLHSAERQQKQAIDARLQEASQVTQVKPTEAIEDDMEDLGEPTDDPSLAQGV